MLATTPRTIADRLRESMKRAGITTAAELARRARLEPGTVRAYVNDTRNPPLDVCEAMGAILGVSGRWLFSGGEAPERQERVKANASQPFQIQVPSKDHLIPVYGSAIGGKDGRFELNGNVLDRIAAPPGLAGAKDAYAVYVVGDSMEPRYQAGEVVFLHPMKPVRKGDYVVVQLHPESDGAPVAGLVKRFVSMNEQKLTLEQLNPEKRIEVPTKLVKAVHRIVMSGEG